MSLFRVDPQKSFDGPHQNQQVVTGGEQAANAEIAMILIHGRGASAQSMMLFSREFTRDDIHYRALQAKGHSWYPHSFMAKKEMNEPGISSGLQAIHDQLTAVGEKGIPPEKVVLLGFSQGACLTTEFAARHPRRYGAVIGLSGGLIGQSVDRDNYSGSLQETPVFLGCSDRDPHIPKERVDETAKIFEQLEATVDKQIYKGMGHTVNKDEINSINTILGNV